MSDERIVIGRDELFRRDVDEALAREKARTGRRPAPPPVSPLRALLLSSTFYLPLAGALAAFVVWLLLEPQLFDAVRVAGTVDLVNEEPFAVGDHEAVQLTVGRWDVLVPPDDVAFEPGADGSAAFTSLADVQVGTPVEILCVGASGGTHIGAAIRPLAAERVGQPTEIVGDDDTFVGVGLFLLTAVAIVVGLALAEGAASGNWVRAAERAAIGAALTAVTSAVAFVPAGLAMAAAQWVLQGASAGGFVSVHTLSAPALLGFMAGRSVAWACIGAGLGLGMNLVRSTRAQLRNTLVGGALGGALGGAFFDPVSRFLQTDSWFTGAETSRAVGLVAVGGCVGFFVALVDQLSREAWVRVRTGPLAGKSFVLYRTPTTVGSSPKCDIYLFKDAEIDAEHVHVHRVGARFEVEDLGSRTGTTVGGRRVRRQRLASGDQIVLGSTVLEFEERARGDAPRGGGA